MSVFNGAGCNDVILGRKGFEAYYGQVQGGALYSVCVSPRRLIYRKHEPAIKFMWYQHAHHMTRACPNRYSEQAKSPTPRAVCGARALDARYDRRYGVRSRDACMRRIDYGILKRNRKDACERYKQQVDGEDERKEAHDSVIGECAVGRH